MKVVTTDGHEYTITRTENEGLVAITGSDEALQCFDDTVVLAGLSEDDFTYYRSPGTRYLHEGTAAMWIQFEVLNYL